MVTEPILSSPEIVESSDFVCFAIGAVSDLLQSIFYGEQVGAWLAKIDVNQRKSGPIKIGINSQCAHRRLSCFGRLVQHLVGVRQMRQCVRMPWSQPNSLLKCVNRSGSASISQQCKALGRQLD